jgi:hypothetical protein
MLCLAASRAKKRLVNASGLAGDAKRISEAGGDSLLSYERRMRVFNLEVIVVVLIVLTILIGWLYTTWLAFENSIRVADTVEYSC